MGLRGLAWGSSRLSALLVLWAAVMLAAPLSQLTTLLLRYPEALTHDGSGQLVSGATVGAVFGLKWGWLAAAVGGVVWRRPASHRDEPPVTASAASDTLPGGEPTDAEPGAPTQSRSPRAPDAPGEAAAEGPGRQPR